MAIRWPSAVRPHLPEDVPLLRVAPHRLLELGDDAARDLPGVLFRAQAAVREDGRADVGEEAPVRLARRPAEDDGGAADSRQAGRTRRETSRYSPVAETTACPSLRLEGARDRIERMTSSAEYEPSALGSMLRIKL